MTTRTEMCNQGKSARKGELGTTAMAFPQCLSPGALSTRPFTVLLSVTSGRALQALGTRRAHQIRSLVLPRSESKPHRAS